jgi:DNA-directed RNA polymerase specialized sigma24 family protein
MTLEIFENERPRLLGIAYRILGSLSDAEDAVQDTFIKWSNVEQDKVINAAAWLTTACTRRCIDITRSSNRNRVNYIGTWLPEPVQTDLTNVLESHAKRESGIPLI